MSITGVNGPEIVNSRSFAVPREQLFAAFSDPTQLVRWWGPKGFTNTIQKFDLRPGGEWLVTMKAPDGAEYPNESIFHVVAIPEKIVWEHLRPVHRFLMTMTYIAEGARSRLTWRMHLETDEGETMRQFFAAANEENFDRLEKHLAETCS